LEGDGMTQRTRLQRLDPEELAAVTTRGPATGRITGINHLMLVCRDFERSLRFYRDLLGMRLIFHGPGRAADAADRSAAFAYDSIAFFRVTESIVFGLYEIRHAPEPAQASTTLEIWPEPERHPFPVAPSGMDHLSFQVGSWSELLWFREHLVDAGVPVSPPFDFTDGQASALFEEHWPLIPTDASATPLFADPAFPVLAGSIYFYDPDGNPVELSTTDRTRP
jgi:catechol 2,3-dioxygenase-like lactoylglutathione lyase family enzyme